MTPTSGAGALVRIIVVVRLLGLGAIDDEQARLPFSGFHGI
jgi:hypothetical protein